MAIGYDDDMIRNPVPAEEADSTKENNSRETEQQSAGSFLDYLFPDDDDAEDGSEAERDGDTEEPEEEQETPEEEPEADSVEKKEKHIRSDEQEELELEHTDQGLGVRLGHDGKQELDELLKDGGEKEEEESPLPVDGFDEEAEKQKNEESLEKEKERRRKLRESYRRRDAALRRQEQERFEQSRRDEEQAQEAKGLEERKNEEDDAYDRMIRDRYSPGYETAGKPAGGEKTPKPAEDDLQIEEESDPRFFSGISRTFRYTDKKSSGETAYHNDGSTPPAVEEQTGFAPAAGLTRTERYRLLNGNGNIRTASGTEESSNPGQNDGYSASSSRTPGLSPEKRQIKGYRRQMWQGPYTPGAYRTEAAQQNVPDRNFAVPQQNILDRNPARAQQNTPGRGFAGISFKKETGKENGGEISPGSTYNADNGYVEQGTAVDTPVRLGHESGVSRGKAKGNRIRLNGRNAAGSSGDGGQAYPGTETQRQDSGNRARYTAKKKNGAVRLYAGKGAGGEGPITLTAGRSGTGKAAAIFGAAGYGAGAGTAAIAGRTRNAMVGPEFRDISPLAAYGETRTIYGKGIVISGLSTKGVLAAGTRAVAQEHRNPAAKGILDKSAAALGLRIGKSRASSAIQVGERKWELTTSEKKRKELLKRIRTESATEQYYKAKRLKSGIIRMEKDGTQIEQDPVSALIPKRKNRINTRAGTVTDSRMSTGDIRGAGKLAAGAAALKRTPGGAGALASQAAAAKMGTAAVMRFHAGQNGQEQSQTESTGSQAITEKIKKIALIVAKKVAVGITATSIAAGAIAGAGTYSGATSDGVNNYFYPVQAHTETYKNSGVMMTQEVLSGMTDRMRAYGIPLQLTGSSAFGNGTVRIHIPGYDREYHGNVEDPWGDSQIMIDGAGNCLLIDGGAREILANKTIDYLKQQNVTHLTAIITHWHTDHYQAIEKMLETTDIKIDTLYCTPETESHNLSREPTGGGDNSSFNYIVNKVRESGGTVIFPPVNTVKRYTFGALQMEMWRLPGEEVEIANDTSLMVYFPELQYLTTGDMEESHNMDKYLSAVNGIVVKSFKLPHHGNGSPDAVGKLRSFGAELAWYNDTLPPGGWRDAAENAQEAGITVFNVLGGDIEVVCENKKMTYYCGNGKTYQVSIPYVGSGTSANTSSSALMQQVCAYAKSWVGKIPYKTTGDPNEERFLPLKEGRGSDCSWFVYHVLEHFSLVGDDFIHSYEWGNSPDKYPNFMNVGTDISSAQPGDIICTGAGNTRHDSHVGIYVGDGKWVECSGGAGGTVLSDVEKNPRQICRYKGSGGIMPTASGGTMSPASQTTYGFTSMTEAIVEAHINDFNYYTFDSFMAKYGGANEQGVTNYLRSLGGVFAKHAGRGEEKVMSAGEFQEMAEFIMGIYTIWGPDYNGSGYAYFIDEDDSRRFYKGMGETGHSFPSYGLLEEKFSDKEHIITDCGSGATQLVGRTCIYPGGYAGMETEASAQNWVNRSAQEYGVTGGMIIHDKSQLQVGDLIQMGDYTKGWRHVCVIGEVWGDGTVITYETGHRFVEDGNYKSVFNPNPSGDFPSDSDYPDYKWWFGVRLRPIAQTGGLSGMGSGGMATQDLKEIKVNSVKVDGEKVSKKGVEMSNLASYTRNGVGTRGVKINYKFVDKDGNVLGESGAGGTFGGLTGGTALTGSAARVIEVAESHMGGPYVYGGDSWEHGIDCSHFVTRVLQEAGVYDGGYMTSYGWAEYGREVPDIEHAQAGDIVISHNRGHVSIYDGVKWVYEAKGSQWGCVHERLPGNIDTIRRILPDGAGTTGGATMQMTAAGGISGGSPVDRTPSGQGQTIEIPDGLGDKYKFMDWAMITSTSSNQYRLREQAGENYDEEGFGIINGRYVIACAMTYGAVGDYVDFYNTNGLIFHCIIGEAKSSNDAGYSKWGHDNGHNIIEFCVQRSKWYGTGHDNPGTASCHPEWKGAINKAVNLGSYFDDPSGMRLTGGGGMLTPGGSQLDYAAMYLMKQILSMSALGSYYSEPVKMEKYGKYCYDLIDYAVCESHGADVEYETTDSGDDEYMECTATVTIECSLPKLEAHDKHFKSWELIFPDGDMMPSNYMEMTKDLFELIFNVDTSINPGQSMMASNPFEGNEQVVYELLRQKGYNAAQIAGIMANIEGESNFRPDAVNSLGASGLIQWMGGRLERLKSLASSKGVDWTDIGAQIDYLDQELKDGSGWNNNTSQKEKFDRTDDPYEAGYLFSRYFERHGIASENAKRGNRAKEYYDKIMVSGSSIQYVQWAIDIANDDSHGYSQDNRSGPDYDCSSLVFFALKNSGFDVGNSPFSTSTMRGIMEKVGFENVHINSVQELLPGDVVWWDGDGNKGHTEIYIGDGKFVGAHWNYDGRQGDGGGDEINVQTKWDADWYQALRLKR